MISVGDVVMVVKPMPCCGDVGDIGYIFKVSEARNDPARCMACRRWDVGLDVLDGSGIGFPISVVRKLNPEKDNVDSDKESYVNFVIQSIIGGKNTGVK